MGGAPGGGTGGGWGNWGGGGKSGGGVTISGNGGRGRRFLDARRPYGLNDVQGWRLWGSVRGGLMWGGGVNL